MSLEGILAIAGIVLAIYSIANPVQRKSINLFVDWWVIPCSLAFSSVVLVWRQGALIFGYSLYPWADFASIVLSFLMPVIAVIHARYSWVRAGLKKSNEDKFREFIKTSLREEKYDELVRIILLNEKLISNFDPKTIESIFERGFIYAMAKAQTWIHLKLFSDENIVNVLPDPGKITDSIMRSLLNEPSSPLSKAVYRSYGGYEHSNISEEEWGLIGNTLHNPKWYMNVRADYPLLMAVFEFIDSGHHDEEYNRKDELYIASQGVSSRSRCPVFLTIKTHVLMLDKAIENDPSQDIDYYVSDILQLFILICNHSRYDEKIWRNEFGDFGYPTRFAFLLKSILNDFLLLCEKGFSQVNRHYGSLGESLVAMWFESIIHLIESQGKVSDHFKEEAMIFYVDLSLKAREQYVTSEEEELKSIRKDWSELFASTMKNRISTNGALRDTVNTALSKMPSRNYYTNKHHGWFRSSLSLAKNEKTIGA